MFLDSIINVNNMYSNIDLYKINDNPSNISVGSVLISDPLSQDPYFSKSVVFIVEHNSEGTVGFIINKRVKIALNDVLKDFPPFDANISIGGPVENSTINFIHTLGDKIPRSKHIYDNIYWGGSLSELKQLIKLNLIKPSQIKFFIGYSGWSQDQIKKEVEKDFWKIVNLPISKIMSRDKNMWSKIVENLGEDYKHWLNVPFNPLWN